MEKPTYVKKPMFMRLPSDAAGIPIRMGDVICSPVLKEKGHKVKAFAVFAEGFVAYDRDNGFTGPFQGKDLVHLDALKGGAS